MNQQQFNQTRYSLISRLKDREDNDSWQQFFDQYWRLIYSVAIKAGLSNEEAEDVVQETVITVLKNIETFRKDPKRGSFKGWLLHTTRWRILDQFRKRKKAEDLMEPLPASSSRTALIEKVPDESGLDLESVWDQEWEHHVLDTALTRVRRQVDPLRYQMFDLHVRKDWPLHKVAKALGLNTGQVHYGKTKVEELLKREVGKVKEFEMTGWKGIEDLDILA